MKKAVVNPGDKDKVIIYGFTPDVWNSEERRGWQLHAFSASTFKFELKFFFLIVFSD